MGPVQACFSPFAELLDPSRRQRKSRRNWRRAPEDREEWQSEGCRYPCRKLLTSILWDTPPRPRTPDLGGVLKATPPGCTNRTNWASENTRLPPQGRPPEPPPGLLNATQPSPAVRTSPGLKPLSLLPQKRRSPEWTSEVTSPAAGHVGAKRSS